MSFKSFLRDKAITIGLIAFALVTVEIFLLIYDLEMYIRIYILVAIFIAFFLGITIEYILKKRYFDKVTKQLDDLDDKYLINEVMDRASFVEGEMFQDILRKTEKSRFENVAKYENSQKEYKEYIELWIHEIKIPIATAKLISDNNKNEFTKRISNELDSVEDYVDQALFYARSNTVEKDYIIRKTLLSDVVSEIIRKNKNALISSRVKVDLSNLDIEVRTDGKWLSFILNQIIGNSIKYMDKEESVIKITSHKGKENIILTIEDNGIGISEDELERVFEKGFTGTNGRMMGKKSTGIGLYLAKKLCDKLEHNIIVETEEGKGTKVSLVFPESSLVNLT